jgi:hypothetical protein
VKKIKVRADFNGIWNDERGTMVCLSHGKTCEDEFGNDVILKEGMEITAFDKDVDENGDQDDLIANGIVERPPDWLQRHGSRWVLRID